MSYFTDQEIQSVDRCKPKSSLDSLTLKVGTYRSPEISATTHACCITSQKRKELSFNMAEA